MNRKLDNKLLKNRACALDFLKENGLCCGISESPFDAVASPRNRDWTLLPSGILGFFEFLHTCEPNPG